MSKEKSNSADSRIADAPKSTGVYIMKDKNNRVIYIGKAKNLRSRVQSYFREKGDGRLSVPILKQKVSSIDYLQTPNEKKALLLEDKLIKEYQPRYNVELKDGKRYFSVKVTLNEEFPRVFLTHQRKDDGAAYFGPFSSSGSARKMVKNLVEKYKLRRCTGVKPRKDGPCMYEQIEGCFAPCEGKFSVEEYKKNIEKILIFLKRAEQMELE